MSDTPLQVSRFALNELTTFTNTLFERCGFAPERAAAMARVLIEADLMGHATHGLALLPWYMTMIDKQQITLQGEPEVIADRGACVTWNGRRLPGAWLVCKAIDMALERAPTYGTVTVVIADGQHIGALAVYLMRATDKGMMILLASSSPSAVGVAPFGGRKALFTPDPLAAGIPTGEGDPILLDISASISTLNLARQLHDKGQDFPYAWAMDADGNPTHSTAAVVSGGGTLLPVGGIDHGHKGFGLALLVESLTQGLGGFGRADSPTGSCSSVMIQVIDPTAFAGRDAFTRQTRWMVDACHDNPPRPGIDRVRLPGERALATRREALQRGVPLGEAILAGLAPIAARLDLAMPVPRG
ncbi:MAG: Ldh family oxidoreductase [Burkholderiaceae bacterium]